MLKNLRKGVLSTMRKTHFTKALCFLLSFCMVFSGFVFAVPTMETVESVVEPTETAADDITLTAWA